MHTPHSLHPADRSSRWLIAVSVVLAAFAYFIPTGRIPINLGFYQFTTGHDIYKMIPLLILPWIGWRCLHKSRPWPTTPLAAPYLLFTGITLLAAVSSINPYQAIQETTELLVYAFFFLILLDLPWRSLRWTWIGGAFVAGNLQLGLETCWQWLSHSKEEVIRVSGPFDHPNALGAYALLATILLLWMAFVERSVWKRSLLALIILLMQCSAVTTASRSGFMAMLLFWLLLWWIQSTPVRVISITMIVGWIVMVVLGFYSLQSRLIDTVLIQSLFDDASRLTIWRGMLTTELSGLPFFGLGLGPILQERLQGSIVTYQGWNPPLTQFGAHNWYLHILMATGLVGFLAFAWFLRESFVVIKRDTSIAGKVLLLGFVTFLIHHVFLDGWMAGNRTVAFMAMLWLAHIRLETTQETETS